MTDHNDFKHHVRERMAKTGEKYSTARRHVLARREAAGPDASAEQATSEQAPATQTPKAAPQRLDEQAFRRFFPRDAPGSNEDLERCKEFVAQFDSPEALLDACAAMMSQPLQAFATAGLRLATNGLGPLSLTGKDTGREPPGMDHCTMWQSDGHPVKFVSQPYKLDMKTLGAMIAWCRKNGLTFTISGGSWHSPGATLLVQFKLRDEDGGGA
jgi:hypothetical protein